MESKKSKKKLLVITSYPEKGKVHGELTVGVASYAKNTLTALNKLEDQLDITVLAEKFTTPAPSEYIDEGITVKRIWKRKSLLTFWNLFVEIFKHHKKTKNVMIELELAMLGGIIQLIPLPLFLFAMKFSGHKVTLINHQVISDMDELSGHINHKKGSLLLKFYNFGLKMLYRSELLLASRIIVFDEILKDKLKPLGRSYKVSVIPHGVETMKNSISKNDARKILDIKGDPFVIVTFGYLAWYKGSDWLIDAVKKMKNKNISLILAGGPNPNHMDKKFYKDYIADIEKRCSENGFQVTGFVKESDIELYYQASDVVVLPYRTLMSASGPLSIALSYKKPFLVSGAMKEIFNTEDIRKILEELKINRQDLYFDTESDLVQKVLRLQKNPSASDKLSKLSEEVSHVRSWQIIAKMYKDILFANK